MASYGFDSTDLLPELRPIRDQIEKIARGYGLDFFDTIFEMIDHDQMNAFAAYGGFPVRYPHWRFGMDFDQLSKGYEFGLQKIYEMVINTDPSYAYLMKSNAMVDQKTVMAHVFGHVDFFKNNIWFSKTNRKMLDTMANHAVRIRNYMEDLGEDTVEQLLDHALSLELLIDPNLPFLEKPNRLPEKDQGVEVLDRTIGRFKNERPYMEDFINPPGYVAEQERKAEEEFKKNKRNPEEPMLDVFGFLIKNAPLKDWERSVLAMVRDEAYYFVPQAQTKIMNEGWASYWHSKIMTEHVLDASEIIDFCDHHAGTLATQPGKLNPYKLGIELFRDIEDRWNRGAFGKEYDECDNLVEKAKWDKKTGQGRAKIFEVRKVCNDVTFIDQYLTPEFVDRFKFYHYGFNRKTNQYEILDRDFKNIKERLLTQLTHRGQPYIYVVDSNFENQGELLLRHKHLGVDLDPKWMLETLKSIVWLWRRPVCISTMMENQPKLYRMGYKNGRPDEFSERPMTEQL